MSALARFFREEGLFTFVRWNYFFTNPPLTITESELREGFGILDRALAVVDAAIEGGSANL
jgi:taurine--2-oxoglutarate transaminase